MKTKTKVALACVAFACMALGGLWVEAAPPRPSSFYGTVKVNGVNPPTWVSVEAWIDGVRYASAPVQIAGVDTVYALDVPGDVPELPGSKQGGTTGEAIQFRVGGLICSQGASWQEGTHTNLNLTATGVLPTATPTDTVVPTDTPTITMTPTETPAVTSTPVIVNLGPANTTVKDTYLDEWVPDANRGGAGSIRLISYGSSFRPMIYFDTSSIPTNATVIQATLNLYLSDYEHNNHMTPNVSVHRVLIDWEELQATWNHRLTGVSWGSAGCSSTADRDAMPVSSTLIGGVNSWYQWPLTSLVQEWVWGPSDNKGIILMSTDWRDLRFHSVDSGHNMPYLRVEYLVGASPGPTTTVTPTETPSVEPSPELLEIRDASQDSFISNFAQEATQNFENCGLRVQAGYALKRSLLDFDVSAVPSGSEIVSATLRLTASNLDDGHTDRTMPISAYLVNRRWVANQVTWQEAETGAGWILPGCDSVPGDRSGTASGTTTVLEPSTGTHPWQRAIYDWDVTAIVQAWTDAPGNQAGLVLVGHDAYREIGFWDSAYSIEDMHPLLLVQWRPGVTPTPTPTPTLTPGLGTVQGIVFVDLNVNGTREPGESGMIGITVQLFSGATLVGLQNTPGSGNYSFGGLAEGTYTVNIVVPIDYASSTQNPRDASVLSGQVAQVDFGIYPVSRQHLPIIWK